MTDPVRRAFAFSTLCTLSLAVPLVGPTAGASIAVAVLAGAAVVTDGPVFDLLATPADRTAERLYGLIAFVLAASALGAIAVTSTMPVATVVAAVLLVGYGDLGAQLVRTRTRNPVFVVAGYCLAGGVTAAVGHVVATTLAGPPVDPALPVVVFFAASAVLLGALLREVVVVYEAPVVVFSTGLLLWLLVELEPTIGFVEMVAVLAITVGIGYGSYALDAASIAGMLTGILLSLLTIVLGGYDWFLVLISFFAIGSLSTKFRYETKAAQGVAQDNEGARGSANVLGNAAVGLIAVLGYAASSVGVVPIEPAELFLFAFVGSVATAMSDTLSSEIGGVYDRPRLITTLEPVEPGTDGGVTWQGELAGVAGAAVVAAIAYWFFPAVDAVGAAIVVVAGVVGMTVDSLLGATLEGAVFGNQAVNFLATLSGAIVCALLAISIVTGG